MPSLDEKMRTCPLKQDIRVTLWETFVRKIISPGQKITSYLTLYSPPMIDIKHFHDVGLLDINESKFSGVVAVAISHKDYIEALSEVPVRPEVMVSGNINDLLKLSRSIRSGETK